MAGQFLRFGRWGVLLTIPGLILVWIIGLIFMPKSCKKEDGISANLTGTWFLTTNTDFTRIDIKENGYFYFDIIKKNTKSTQYKGMIFKESKDIFTLISFKNDTLLYHRIVEKNERKLTLKSIKDNTIVTFIKE